MQAANAGNSGRLEMSRTESAVNSFRKPYSCAQTVFAAFSDGAPDEELMREMLANSGGRAPENMCGALFAAVSLRPDKAEEIKKRFAEKAGSTRCQELKSVHKTPCAECVRIAAQTLEDI